MTVWLKTGLSGVFLLEIKPKSGQTLSIMML